MTGENRRKATDAAKMSDEALVEARDRLNAEIERRKYEARQRLRALGDEPAFQNCTFENCTFEGFIKPDEGQPIDLRPSDEAIAEVESLRILSPGVTIVTGTLNAEPDDDGMGFGCGVVGGCPRPHDCLPFKRCLNAGTPNPVTEGMPGIPAFLRRAQA